MITKTDEIMLKINIKWLFIIIKYYRFFTELVFEWKFEKKWFALQFLSLLGICIERYRCSVVLINSSKKLKYWTLSIRFINKSKKCSAKTKHQNNTNKSKKCVHLNTKCKSTTIILRKQTFTFRPLSKSKCSSTINRWKREN